MKKIIFSKEVSKEKIMENWSVREIVKQIDLKFTYNQYPTISDQEVEVWEKIPEPWAVDSIGFKEAFLEYFQNNGGD